MLIYADLSSFVCNLRIVLCHISRPNNGVGVQKMIDMMVSDKAIKSLYDHARPHSPTSTHSRNRQSPSVFVLICFSLNSYFYPCVRFSFHVCFHTILAPASVLGTHKSFGLFSVLAFISVQECASVLAV